MLIADVPTLANALGILGAIILASLVWTVFR